jgi:rhomboid protease GluP
LDVAARLSCRRGFIFSARLWIIHFSNPNMQPLFARLSAERAHTYGLVLSALNIAHQVSRQGPLWSLAVRPVQRAEAIEAISLYLKENPARSPHEQTIFNIGTRSYSAWYVASIVALIHLLIALGAEQGLFASAFGANADQIMNGELYRCVTALLLHTDGQHLLGNLVGMILFGTVVASLCGWGLGWSMILVSGFTGNLLTALWYRHNHIAIGASTAVFGAVGICTILSLRIGMWGKTQYSQLPWRRWMPLAGGLALLGLLGTSPQADLMAHMSGFAVGLLLGGLGGLRAGRLPHQAPVRVQWAAALASMGIVAACWLRGSSCAL